MSLSEIISIVRPEIHANRRSRRECENRAKCLGSFFLQRIHFVLFQSHLSFVHLKIKKKEEEEMQLIIGRFSLSIEQIFRRCFLVLPVYTFVFRLCCCICISFTIVWSFYVRMFSIWILLSCTLHIYWFFFIEILPLTKMTMQFIYFGLVIRSIFKFYFSLFLSSWNFFQQINIWSLLSTFLRRSSSSFPPFNQFLSKQVEQTKLVPIVVDS